MKLLCKLSVLLLSLLVPASCGTGEPSSLSVGFSSMGTPGSSQMSALDVPSQPFASGGHAAVQLEIAADPDFPGGDVNFIPYDDAGITEGIIFHKTNQNATVGDTPYALAPGGSQTFYAIFNPKDCKSVSTPTQITITAGPVGQTTVAFVDVWLTVSRPSPCP